MPFPSAPVSEENPNTNVTNEDPWGSETTLECHSWAAISSVFGHAYNIMCNLWSTPDSHVHT